MPTTIPIMPFVFLTLFLLPIKLSGESLKKLAFIIWMTGGIVLVIRGVGFIAHDPIMNNTGMVFMVVSLAVIIGFVKGKFVLSKTSRKNIERLDALEGNQRLLNVYSIRSWIIISLMVCIAVALNVFPISGMLRGSINLGIGIGLIVSSLAYLSKSNCCSLKAVKSKPN